jgi:adenosine deaminase
MTSPKTITDYIQSAPKVELHLHIEGSFEPELVFQIAQRNGLEVKVERPAPTSDAEIAAIEKLAAKAQDIGLTPLSQSDGGIKVVFESPDQLGQAYDFDNLQEFLDIYYAGMNVLQTQQDFYDLTMAYLKKCHEQNVMHVEIFFDPQGHTCRGVAFDTVINGIHNALLDGEVHFGISSALIMSYLRHLSEEDALKTWQEAQPHLDKFIGVGLDSSELGHPPSKFTFAFALARAAGKKCVAHAGEEGPPSYVYEALDLLQIDRVDHGNRSLEDPQLVERLVREGKALTVCPLSNDKLQVVGDMHDHPIKKMLDFGLIATINSDDPAYFGGYMNENFEAIQQALDLSIDDVYTLITNSIQGSFASDARKAELRSAVEAFHNDFIQSAA